VDCGFFELAIYKEYLKDNLLLKKIFDFLTQLLDILKIDEIKVETQEMRNKYFMFGFEVQTALDESLKQKQAHH